MKKLFNKDDLEFFLPDRFKGLSKEYIIKCIFDDEIQRKWTPNIGDLIVTHTGNIYAISAKSTFCNSLGGVEYYFGGGRCSRDGSCYMSSTFCYSANRNGEFIDPKTKKTIYDSNHSNINDFRYIPYPHEIPNKGYY